MENQIRERLQRDAMTSMLYWFPKINQLGIQMPKTVTVETPNAQMGIYIEGEEKLPAWFCEQMQVAGKMIGYPLFLRTDLVSGKFEWGETCCVNGPEQLFASVTNLISFAECATFIGLPTRAFIFRELLQLQSDFKAFNGMPVAKERRYFVQDGKVICHHSYWIQEAIAKWLKGQAAMQRYCQTPESLKALQAKFPPSDWKEKLAVLNHESPEEVAELTVLAEKATKELPGFWSIDFAYGRRKTVDPWSWFLIDAARGEDSSHVVTCPNCPEEQKKHPDGGED